MGDRVRTYPVNAPGFDPGAQDKASDPFRCFIRVALSEPPDPGLLSSAKGLLKVCTFPYFIEQPLTRSQIQALKACLTLFCKLLPCTYSNSGSYATAGLAAERERYNRKFPLYSHHFSQ